MSRVRGGLGWLGIGVLVAYMLAPILVVIAFAFQGSSSTSLPFEGPSLRWVREVFGDAQFRTALGSSLKVAAATAVISTAIGLLAALATSRRGGAGPYFRLLAILPLATPPVFIGFSLLLSAGDLGWSLSLWVVLAVHVLLTAPICWAILDSSFERFDVAMEEASRDLGATSLQSFTQIRLPIIWRPMLGTSMIAFAFSIEEFAVTNFVIGSTPTLPILVWGKMRRSVDPSINVVALTILALLLLVGICGWLLVRRSRKKAEISVLPEEGIGGGG